MAVASARAPRLEVAARSGERVPVLFVAGAARSGSTLLDRVIGAHEGFFSSGELTYIWQRSFRENHLCGCGTPFHECGFWREVTEDAFGVEPAEVDAEAAEHLKARVDSKWRVPYMALPHAPHHQPELLAYSELLARLYNAILRVSGARVIVDSSKDPRHGLVLSKLPNIELHVVHLVRDPRGVAFSWKRVRRRPEIHWKAQNMMVKPIWGSASRWTTHNVVAELLSASAASYCRVRYEDFVADPGAAMADILAPFPWARESDAGIEGNELVLEPMHTMAGNPMRFHTGALKLRLDEEWRRAMPLRERLTVEAATWPLLGRYGYSMRTAA
jgi:Sulfotransferase family